MESKIGTVEEVSRSIKKLRRMLGDYEEALIEALEAEAVGLVIEEGFLMNVKNAVDGLALDLDIRTRQVEEARAASESSEEGSEEN